MSATISIVLSVFSLGLSIFTLWMTQLRRGELKMTRPALICLRREQPSGRYKLFVRSLLYSTSIRGYCVEHMYARIKTEYGSYLFDFWGHTEAGKLTLGSGLFVGQTGIGVDHHFNPRNDQAEFIFCGGRYHVELFARTAGNDTPIKLKELSFDVSGLQSGTLIQILDTELHLYWNPDTDEYDSELRKGPEEFLLEPKPFPSWFDARA